MAYSEYPTQLPLDRFFEIVGLHPWHANQLRTPALENDQRQVGCDSVIYQHRYQSNSGIPGRNDIARAIFEAERDIEKLVHFPLIKRWIVNERVPMMYGRPFKLEWNAVVSAGIRTTALIEEGVSISTEDFDEDSFEETALITTVLTQEQYDALGDPEELRIFYPDKGPLPEWEIRPIRVSIDDDTLDVSIRCNLCQLVDPRFYERMIPGVLDPEDSVYLDAVDIYRIYNDPSIGTAYRLYADGVLSETSTSGLILRTDLDGGVVDISQYPFGWGSICACLKNPSAKLSYVAGYPGSTYTRMATPLENAVAILAMSRLGGICGCTKVPSYNRDLMVISETETSGPGLMHQTRWGTPPARVTKNPFGTSEGERMAYDIIVTEILGETGNSYL